MKEIHASKMPLYARCPGAFHHGGIEIDFPNVAADVGTEVHGNLSALLRDGVLPDMGDATDEVRALTFIGKKWWDEYGHLFPDPAVEERALYDSGGGWAVCGTPDACAIADGTLRVLDWKTTRLDDADYRAQLMTYLWLAMAELGPDGFTEAQYVIVYLRDKTHEVSRRLTHDDVFRWGAWELINRVINWDGTYHPGAHCRYCPAFASCEARAAIVQSTALALIEGGGLPSTGEELLDLYRKAQVVEKAISDFRDAVRLEVEKAGGRIDCGDAELALVESERADIDVRAAWPHLRAALPDGKLAECLSIHKGRLLGFIGDLAPRGEEGATKDQFMETLEAAGAVKHRTITQLRTLTKKGVQGE